MWGHNLMLAHFLAIGALYFWGVVGVDPNPRNSGRGVQQLTKPALRVIELAATVPFHAFFGVVVMMSTVSHRALLRGHDSWLGHCAARRSTGRRRNRLGLHRASHSDRSRRSVLAVAEGRYPPEPGRRPEGGPRRGCGADRVQRPAGSFGRARQRPFRVRSSRELHNHRLRVRPRARRRLKSVRISAPARLPQHVRYQRTGTVASTDDPRPRRGCLHERRISCRLHRRRSDRRLRRECDSRLCTLADDRTRSLGS